MEWKRATNLQTLICLKPARFHMVRTPRVVHEKLRKTKRNS